jgi:hypothetical protein
MGSARKMCVFADMDAAPKNNPLVNIRVDGTPYLTGIVYISLSKSSSTSSMSAILLIPLVSNAMDTTSPGMTSTPEIIWGTTVIIHDNKLPT